MGVMEIFVTTGLGVCDIGICVMVMNIVMMDLMKQIVVRKLKLCAKSLYMGVNL